MTPEQQKALALANARRRQAAGRNDDGTYGEVPPGMVFDPKTQQYTSRELMANRMQPSGLESFRMGDIQGFTLGSADEMSGVGGDLSRERFRAMDEAARRDNPGAYTAGRVVGSVMSPVSRLMPNKATIPGAMATAGAVSAVEGFAEGEGSAADRLVGAAQRGATGAIFGGLTAAAFKGASYGLRRAFQVADERPSMETLKAARNAAYAEVRRSGVKFEGNDTQALSNRLSRLAKTARWDIDPEFDEGAIRAIRAFERRAGKPLSLNNLDKMRQRMWDVYSKTDEPFVIQAIEEIDNLIAKKAEGNSVMLAARQANSIYAKAQLLENAFDKARLQTASTGSGGNILNKYRQAVTRIITTPREAKWFSDQELAVMRSFVEGNNAENILRRVGKLAPGGNGLMTALNVYAASVDPSMLAITAVGTAAKGAADKSAMQGSENILDVVTGFERPAPPPLQLPAIGGAVGGNQYFNN